MRCSGADVTSVAQSDDLGIGASATPPGLPTVRHRNKRTFDPGHLGTAAARCDQTPMSVQRGDPVAQLHTTSTPSAGSAVPTQRPEPRQGVTVGEEFPMSEVLRRYGGDDRPTIAQVPARRSNPKPTTRRVGYLVAAVVNGAMLWVANHLLGWGWPRSSPTRSRTCALGQRVPRRSHRHQSPVDVAGPSLVQASGPTRAECHQSGGHRPQLADLPARLHRLLVGVGGPRKGGTRHRLLRRHRRQRDPNRRPHDSSRTHPDTRSHPTGCEAGRSS